MRYSKDDTINNTVRRLLRAGWTVKSQSRHVRLTDGKLTITVPVTPSDRRAALNWHSQIRRAGVDLAAVGC